MTRQNKVKGWIWYEGEKIDRFFDIQAPFLTRDEIKGNGERATGNSASSPRTSVRGELPFQELAWDYAAIA